jgi:hypothetical protein
VDWVVFTSLSSPNGSGRRRASSFSVGGFALARGNIDPLAFVSVEFAGEPIVDIADKSGAAVIGLIHVNKSGSNDPLTSLMGSRAFTAVARAVLFLMLDPDDDKVRLLGQPKNNLGRLDDLPTMTFTIESATVAETSEGLVTTGRIIWGADSAKSIREAIDANTDGPLVHTAVGEALDWLVDYLTSQGGAAPSAEIRAVGGKAGHTKDALDRARKRGRIQSSSFGYPRQSQWSLPDAITVIATPGESPTTTTTTTTQTTGQSGLDPSHRSHRSHLRPPRACDDRTGQAALQ